MTWEAWPLWQQALLMFAIFTVGMGSLVFIAWWFFCPPLTEEDKLP